MRRTRFQHCFTPGPAIPACSRFTVASALAAIMLVLMAAACEKADLTGGEQPPEEEVTEGCKVSIKVTKIGGQTTGTAQGAADIKDLCGRISYAVLGTDGKAIKTKHQTAADAGFGSVTLSLPAGSYRLVVIAHDGAGNVTFESEEKIKFKDNKVTDTFAGKTDMTVSGTHEFGIELKRMVAKIRMEITDEMPADVKQMEFYYTGGSSTLSMLSGYGSVNSRQTEYRAVTSDMVGKSTRFEIFTFPHDKEGFIKLTVKALDADKNALQTKTFENIPVKQDARTVFSDNFFGSIPTGGSSGETDLTLDLTDNSGDEEITGCH